MAKKKKYKSKNEFRYNKKTKHPVYIFEDDGKKYNGVGITHKPKTFGKDNMPLDSNPQKNKTDASYIRNGIVREKHELFGDKTLKDFKFSKSDFPKVKSKIRNFKNNRRKKQTVKRKTFYTVSILLFIVVVVFFIVRFRV